MAQAVHKVWNCGILNANWLAFARQCHYPTKFLEDPINLYIRAVTRLGSRVSGLVNSRVFGPVSSRVSCLVFWVKKRDETSTPNSDMSENFRKNFKSLIKYLYLKLSFYLKIEAF